MQIDWWTLGLQTINFLILVWLLTRFLYRPVRDTIAKRQAASEAALVAARQKAQDAEAARARYEAGVAELDQRRRELEAQVHHDAEAEADRVIEAAQAEAAKRLEEAEASAAGARVRVLAAMKDEMAATAGDLATRVLKLSGMHGAGPETRAALGDYIAALPEQRRAELRTEIRTGSDPVEVVTAAPLSDAERDAWAAAVRDWFGDGTEARFVTEPEVLGGAGLRLPHAELDFTWASQLRDAQRRMLEEAE